MREASAMSVIARLARDALHSLACLLGTLLGCSIARKPLTHQFPAPHRLRPILALMSHTCIFDRNLCLTRAQLYPFRKDALSLLVAAVRPQRRSSSEVGRSRS